MDEHTVGDVARLSGVSVRTLHHYDEVGLLAPGGRSPSGYRLYSEADVARLRHVLFYRELDFGLDEIAEILADPDAQVGDHLRRQHRLLRERQARTAALLGAIEHEMEARQMGISLTPGEQFEILGADAFSAEYAEEAEQRWGHTDEWKQSQRRVTAHTKEDWIAIKRETDAVIQAFIDASRAGEPATGSVAMAVAEDHRRQITRWFYDCGYDQHRRLAELYVDDPRFIATRDETVPGLSSYVHDAIHANADRAEGTTE